MDFYLRKNGTVAGPMSQADFLARLANGEYAATDEMSTDGRVWTRLGLTGFARSIQQGRFVAAPRLGSVVPDLTKPGQAAPSPPAPAPAPAPVAPRRRSPLVPILAVLLVAALGAVAWFALGKPGLSGKTATAEAVANPGVAPGVAPDVAPVVGTAATLASTLPSEFSRSTGIGLNPAFVEWVRKNSNEPDARSFVGRSAVESGNFGFVPGLRDMSYLATLETASTKSLVADVPSQARLRKFDLRAENRVTSAKDQGMYGTCWAQAAIGSVESAWKLKTGKDVDLSENNLVNGHGWHRTGWFGNTADTAESYFLSWRGAYLEKDDPYAHPSAVASGNPVVHLQQVRWIPGMRDASDTARIKAAIVSWGGLWTAYCCGDQKLSDANGFYYNGTDYPNHAVLIVGWDDDFPKEKFLVQPPGNGAWLVKNSWGERYGDKGFFYVSYFDRWFAKDERIIGPLYAFCGVESADNYSRIYQHDPFGCACSFPWSLKDEPPPRFGANVFVAAGDETISAVGLYALGPDTSYSISIRKGLAAQWLSVSGEKRPSWDMASGVCVLQAQKGTLDTAGFFTIPLETPVSVSSGEAFSVQIELSTPGLNCSPLATELREQQRRDDGVLVEVPSPSVEALPGQSFFSQDGVTWIDLFRLGGEFAKYQPNLCIKAYARPAGGAQAQPAANDIVQVVRKKAGLNPEYVDWVKRGGGESDGAGLAPSARDMSHLSDLETQKERRELVSGFRAAATAAANRAPASPRGLSPATPGAQRSAPIPSAWARSATVREAIASLSGGKKPAKLLSSPALPKTAVVNLDDPLVVKAILSYVTPSENSQKLLLEKIKLSDHVHDKFPATADNALFAYLPDDDLVTADASIVSDEGGATHGRIRLYGGLVRMARTMGAVLCAGLPSRNREPAAVLAFLEALGSGIRTAGGKFSTDAMLDLLDQFETDPECFTDLSRRARAETVANAIVTAALAHEFGHLAKGHLNGTDANHIVTQIEEKEADLFASTIAASSPEGPHVFMGQVFVMTIFSFIDDGSGSGLRTHPVPRDRVFEAIRNNPDYAAKAGITEEGFRTWFREIDEKKGK